MSATGDAYNAILAALGTVDGLKITKFGDAAKLRTPGVIVAPTTIDWETFQAPPTSAVFHVNIVVAWDGREVETLTNYAELAAAAIETLRYASVTGCVLTAYPAIETNLPCYQLTVECGLGQ